MLLSYVLRLVPSALADGRLAGTVQTVETGETAPFASPEELLRLLVPQPRTASGRTIDLREVTTLPLSRKQRG